MQKRRGFLVAIEGGEGAGKTTQVARLVERLKKMGWMAMQVREPGGNRIAEQIRQVVLDAENKKMAQRAETLLYMAARAQLYAEVVGVALEQDKVVVMDRTRDSSVVYQGLVRGQGVETVEWLNDFATEMVRPDVTVLLDVPVKVGFGRMREVGKEADRMERQGKKFHEAVRVGYLQLMQADRSGRWVMVDGTASVEVVAEEIWKVVEARVQAWKGQR